MVFFVATQGPTCLQLMVSITSQLACFLATHLEYGSIPNHSALFVYVEMQRSVKHTYCWLTRQIEQFGTHAHTLITEKGHNNVMYLIQNWPMVLILTKCDNGAQDEGLNVKMSGLVRKSCMPANPFTCLHADATPGARWTLSECCSQPECDHPQAACQQKSDAAGQEGCPPCPGSWT